MKNLRYCMATLILISMGTTAHGQASALSDPVKRNHFCNDYFSQLDQWEQCHDMWPYGDKSDTPPKAKWRLCEKSSINASKLDQKKMASCLLQYMRG